MAHSSSKRSEINSFLAMDVLRQANLAELAGRPVIHMEVGQPGAPVPQTVINAAQSHLATGRLGYTDALGIKPLRERIAQHYKDYHNLDLNPDRVVVTTGSSGAFNLTFLAAFDPGDKIGLPSPSYPAYRNILKALGLEVVDLPTSEADRWTLSERLLIDAHEKEGIKGVLVASPANPSGTMLTPQALKRICEICEERNIRFISDEIYHRLTFTAEQEETALQHSDNVFVINSFSKYYCMTGWRIGWMVVPENMIRPIEKLAQNLFISAPELSQWAGVAAFDATDGFEAIKQDYEINREAIAKAFSNIGFNHFLPVDGAFYYFVDVSDFTEDSLKFSSKLLAEIDIAATPGADFDPFLGHQFMRFSFAGKPNDINVALERLSNWLPNQLLTKPETANAS